MDQLNQIKQFKTDIKELKLIQEEELENLRAVLTDQGYSLLANISKLAQIALNFVDMCPQASGLSLQISNIIDELGFLAQWLLGKQKASMVFKQGQGNEQP